jgi:hypothetical protein
MCAEKLRSEEETPEMSIQTEIGHFFVENCKKTALFWEKEELSQ